MKRVLLLFVIGFVLLPAYCRAADETYGYPIPDPYDATIMGTPEPLKAQLPTVVPTRQLVLTPIPGIKKPDIFFYDDGLHCTLAYQKKKAPLIFVIAGTGASYQSPKELAIMRALYKNGLHVITLSSPTYPNFIINASSSHIPGDLTEDAEDLYRVMEAAWNEVKGDIEVSEFFLAGYSLGGTQAAFVAKLDSERKIFNFGKVLMINPAVSLYDSVSRIEGLLNDIPGGPDKIGAFLNKMMAKFMAFYREGDFIDVNNEFLYAVYESKLMTKEEAGGLIGLAFRISLAGMVFTSDVMTNGGYVVPKNRVLKVSDSLSEYFRVSAHLSFLDYFNEYLYPHFEKKRPGLTKEELIRASSLKSIEGYLKSTSKIGVITSGNEVILTPEEVTYLRELFGERTKVFPRGGHMGNLEYIDNMAYLSDFVGFFNK